MSLLTGDTWVDTPPSDPLLAAQFRALMRARRQCIATNPTACPANPDPSSAFYNFSRYLIKNIEHDWGPSGSFPTTGSGGVPTDCGAVKSFAGVHGHGRFGAGIFPSLTMVLDPRSTGFKWATAQSGRT